MTTTTTTINKPTESSIPDSLVPTIEEPLDKTIEHIIRKGKALTITKSRGIGLQLRPGADKAGLELLPDTTRQRMVEAGVDLSRGYPELPPADDIPIFVDEAHAIRDYDYPYIERGNDADPEKKALFGAAKEVRNLTTHIGTEIIGLQLEDLNDQQKDELALLIAERGVVFFHDQKLTPQKQLELGHYWGNVEVHAQVPHVPGLPGETVIWNDYLQKRGMKINFKNCNLSNWDALRYPTVGNQIWHSDLVHERQPAGYTHLHLDAFPEAGDDTLWASGYGAYDKLSEEFKRFLDGKEAVYVSAHTYLDRDDPFGGPKRIERVHPLVRTHPATGWKFLFVNRGMTRRILGVSPVESDLILNYLFDIYEKNADIQVRFKWNSKPGYGTSAIWDNRSTQHRSVWDNEGKDARHGTRVTSLAEKPFFDPKSKSRREALGLSLEE